jgi:hypothetical protein
LVGGATHYGHACMREFAAAGFGIFGVVSVKPGVCWKLGVCSQPSMNIALTLTLALGFGYVWT